MKSASIAITYNEVVNLIEGLDAYRYWQLTADHGLEYLRNGGDVRVDEIEDEHLRAEFAEIDALESRLEAIRLELLNADQTES